MLILQKKLCVFFLMPRSRYAQQGHLLMSATCLPLLRFRQGKCATRSSRQIDTCFSARYARAPSCIRERSIYPKFTYLEKNLRKTFDKKLRKILWSKMCFFRSFLASAASNLLQCALRISRDLRRGDFLIRGSNLASGQFKIFSSGLTYDFVIDEKKSRFALFRRGLAYIFFVVVVPDSSQRKTPLITSIILVYELTICDIC